MRRHSFLALLVTLYAVALPCFGQMNQSGQNYQRRIYSISGKVNDDADEHGIDNVRVNLSSDGLVLNSVYSSDGGNFQFDGVAPGNYVIDVQLEGFDHFTATVTVSRAPVVSFSVGLTKSLAAGPNAGHTVTAHQLSVPAKARDAYEKGLNLLSSRADFEGSIAQFQHAIKEFPGYYEAYAMEGVAYMSLQNTAAAELALRKSIDMSASHYPDALYLFAGLLSNTGRLAEAEAAARASTMLAATSWAAHYELAHALYLMGHQDESEPEASRAHELAPDNPKIVLLLADIHLQRRNYNAALQDMDVYLKLDPTGPDADQIRKDRDQVLQGLPKLPTADSPSEKFEQ
jgi:tetratricopeptide (TPR) repeat protein